MKPLKIGHRGAMGFAPENTLASFQKAIMMNCDGVEFDVQLTKDGKVYVFHDETLERLAGFSGYFRDRTSSEIDGLRVQLQRIPQLCQVLEMLPPNMLVNIEIKTFEATEATAEIISAYVKFGNYSRFLVSSFDWNSLSALREINPKIPIGVLTHTNLDLAVSFSEFIKAESIHPHFHLLNAQNVSEIKAKAIKVFAWTVNEPNDIALVKSFGVDAIITDYPDRL